MAVGDETYPHEYWLARAAQAQLVAEHLQSHECQSAMYSIAASYVRIAEAMSAFEATCRITRSSLERAPGPAA